MKTLIWVTNGIDCIRVLPDKIPNGYHRGRILPKRKGRERNV